MDRERPTLARRSFLSGLGAAPIAAMVAGLPLAAHAGGADDAAVVRLAARVERLARIENRLLLQVATIEDGIVNPPHPVQPPSDFIAGAWDQEGKTFTASFNQGFGETDPAWLAFKQATTERDRECVRLRQAAGLPRLEHLRDLALDRLTEATEALTALPCGSLAGLSAKARAWIAIEAGGSEDEWTKALAVSVITAVAALHKAPTAA